MGQFTLQIFLRYILTLLIGFFVARHQLSADVAQKLNAGDNVELFGGAWTFNLKQVIDFLMISIIPTLALIVTSIYQRARMKYQLFMAMLTPKTLTHEEVKDITANAPVSTIIKSAINPPA